MHFIVQCLLNASRVCHDIWLRDAYIMHISLFVPIHVHVVQSYKILVVHRWKVISTLFTFKHFSSSNNTFNAHYILLRLALAHSPSDGLACQNIFATVYSYETYTQH